VKKAGLVSWCLLDSAYDNQHMTYYVDIKIGSMRFQKGFHTDPTLNQEWTESASARAPWITGLAPFCKDKKDDPHLIFDFLESKGVIDDKVWLKIKLHLDIGEKEKVCEFWARFLFARVMICLSHLIQDVQELPLTCKCDCGAHYLTESNQWYFPCLPIALFR
jgi:hypothetical protein